MEEYFDGMRILFSEIIYSIRIHIRFTIIQVLKEIKNIQFEVWYNIKNNLNKNICLINYNENTT
jgi:hypothetical protein